MLWRTWWQLPGPARFIDEIGRLIRTRQNVILALPSTVDPESLFLALEDRTGDVWLHLRGSAQAATEPDEFLARELLDAQAVRAGRNVADCLARADWLKNRVICLGSLEKIERWGDFLAAFAQVARLEGEASRPCIVLTTVGIPPSGLPKDDVALCVRRYDDYCDPFDMELLVHTLRAEVRKDHRLLEDLRRQIVVELGLGDPEFAQRLALADLRQLLEPTQILREYAAQHGWGVGMAPCWHRGSASTLAKGERVHSAFLAARGDVAVTRRLWAAQLRILFPVIEELRLRAVERIGDDSKLLGRVEPQMLQQVTAWEAGYLHKVAIERNAPRWFIGHLKLLRDVRNCLAHREPATEEQIRELSKALANL